MENYKSKIGYKAVFAIFDYQPSMEAAITEFRNRGFRNSDISVLMQSEQGIKNFGYVMNTKAPEGTVAGASAGLVLGAALGWIAGIGTFLIPGTGLLIAAGPLLAAMAGAGVIGTLGGITGALVGMGIPEYEAKRFEYDVADGGMLVSVHVDNNEWSEIAKDILEDAGARDISVANEADGKWYFDDKSDIYPHEHH
jgi:hypothetical protein